MNAQLKTILLTLLTLSLFVIALVELSGISSTALFNKYGIEVNSNHSHSHDNDHSSTPATLNPSDLTMVHFDTTRFDFGKIKDGTKVQHTFKIKNTGAVPLVITNVSASCGCTIPSYSKEPVAPSAEADIHIEFDSKDRKGIQQKNILVTANVANSPFSLGFKAEVE